MNQGVFLESIIRALSFFDLFDLPLTREEIFRYAWSPPSAGKLELENILDNLPPEKIGNKFGYYFLSGRETIVEERRRRVAISDQKIKRARAAVKWLRQVPFIKAVFVCNSVAFGSPREKSDIDLFIITVPGRIWVARFFANLILKLTLQRIGKLHSANKICLSFFLDSKHLDLSPLAIAPDDVYLAYWALTLIPLFDPEAFYAQILKTNRWLDKFLPNAKGAILPPALGKPGLWQRLAEPMWRGSYGNIIENDTKKIQLMKLSYALKDAAKKPDKNVIIADGILKFHEHDLRRVLRDKWLAKCGDLLI
ncbi:MAG: hypothetical protein Q7K39_04460 [Candidatus Magasanikbacteria bacterium]|nr:hypothetical protein [Candidatus Magasanikbacteria bacterium]